MSGGAGKAVAEWMIKGHTDQDLFSLDVKRFEKFNSSLKFIKKEPQKHSEIFLKCIGHINN